MRYKSYSKYIPELVDAINIEELIDELSDFLLQSGFAGGPHYHPFWGDFGTEDSDHSLNSLRQAIMDALINSGKLTPEMLQVLRGESTGDEERDREIQQQLAELIDQIVQRLVEEGFLQIQEAPRMPEGHQQMFGPGGQPGGQAHSAAQQVNFNLTDKAIDFLGYRALKNLLGSIGKSSFGSHETPYLATGVEAEAVSKPYEYGDTLNLDVSSTLTNALKRNGLAVPVDIDYPDLMVSQAEYRSSAATVLMLDCSHSMILYGEDRFTPAKKVALALTHLIQTQFPGDSLKVVLFHDTAEEIPISHLARAQVGPYHTNTAEGLKLSRKILLSQKKDMRQIIMITDGKPSALTLPDGRVYVNSMGLDPKILKVTFREVNQCKRSGVMINTFMLAREPSLVRFVKKVCEICRGKAYFTSTVTLGQHILMDFMRRKTRRVG
jgi:Ca-activated chloride channel family protein